MVHDSHYYPAIRSSRIALIKIGESSGFYKKVPYSGNYVSPLLGII